MKCYSATARLRACEKKCKADFEGTEIPETCLFYPGCFVVWQEEQL